MSFVSKIITDDCIISNSCTLGRFNIESDKVTIYLPVWRLHTQIRLEVKSTQHIIVDCNNLQYLFTDNSLRYKLAVIDKPVSRYITLIARKDNWAIETTNHITFEVEKCLDLV